MKKLKLNLEDLKVESFETTEKLNKRGTVNGNGTGPLDPTCDEVNTCNGISECGGDTCALTDCQTCYHDTCECTPPPTPGETCGWTCGSTCPGDNTCDFTCDPCV